MEETPAAPEAEAEPDAGDDEVGEAEEGLGDSPSAPGDRALSENSEAEALPGEAV